MTPTAVAQTLYAGFAAGDVEAVLGTLADDVSWTEAEGYVYAGTFVGPAAVAEGVFARLGSEWEGYAATPESYVAEGDTVVVIGTYSGTYVATGKAFAARFAHVITVTDDRIVRFEQIVDSALVARALVA